MSVAYLSSLRALTRTRQFGAFLCALFVVAGSGVPVFGARAATAPTSATPAIAPASALAGNVSVLPQAGPNAGASPATYTYRIPLLRKDVGTELTLLGEDAYAGLDFGLRRDERVVSARLVLDFRYSPTLLPTLSHLNVLLNSVVGATIPLPQPASKTFTRLTVDLPVSLLTEFNRLNLELIGHSKASDEGNNPLSADLWLKAGLSSAIEMTVAPIDFPNDLARLPEPFVDNRDVRRVDLPVILPRTPSNARLASAGIVTSWLGAKAGYRGAHFAASPGVIPAHGNAVALALNGELPSLGLPAVDGPSLAIVANPNDSLGKVLLVTGRNEAELREAATALVMGWPSLSGAMVKIDGPVKVAPRKPYDAPNWLPSDRPVQLGELQPASSFTVAGFAPGTINVGLRVPPGLFGFDSSGAVLNLHYRYTARPESTRSQLRVLIGNTPIGSEQLPGDRSDGQVVMPIPTYLLPPLTTLQFDYDYEYVKPKGHWQDTAGGPLLSAIDPTSTIDISALPRYAEMPDLRAFGDAGFPFTRLADLSETAVILPVRPVADDYSAYLTLMGSMGQASGYPVLGVTVGEPSQVNAFGGKDLLVLASGDNQPLLKTWRGDLPAGFFGPVRSTVGAIANEWNRLIGNDANQVSAAAKAEAYSGGEHDGLIAGFESPLARGRSVVVVSSKSPAGLDAVVDVLQAHRYLANESPNDTVGGSLVAAHHGTLTTLEANSTYFVGSLPIGLGVEWFFASHILLLLVATLISIVLIGLLGGVFLHRRALNRLALDLPQTSQREEGRGTHV